MDTTVSAGTDQIAERLAAAARPGTGIEVGAEVNLGLEVGKLTAHLEREHRRRQLLNMCITVVDIGPLAFTVAGGVASLAGYRSSGSDMSPQEGLIWDVTRLSLYGLNAGDMVNLYRPAGPAVAYAGAALHTFLAPAGVGAGLGIADWEPGAHGCMMRPDDVFALASAGTLATANLILSGQAVQVDLRVLADYLL